MSIIKLSATWNIDEGIEICREIQSTCHENGYHCGLIGSVLNTGRSYNDLDIIIVKLAQTEGNLDNLIKKLSEYFRNNLIQLDDPEYLDDDRNIYRVIYNDKQIDFMVIL